MVPVVRRGAVAEAAGSGRDEALVNWWAERPSLRNCGGTYRCGKRMLSGVAAIR